ncbi:MAG: phospho-sugar mutase [Pirellulales bacterium]
MPAPAPFDAAAALSQMEAAGRAGKLSAGAVENIRVWLSEPRYAEYAPQVAEHLAQGRFQELDDVFWTIIPFGTGGRRGKMYPIGSNAINDRTIGESAQGLADYVRRTVGGNALSCGIAYDTRHRSRHFAELCAEVMVAAGFTVYFLDGYRSTPELSFLVRHKHCSCGIMVTASHNPPSDNAVKVYWSTGGQLLPPHDSDVIECVMSAGAIQRTPFAAAVQSGQIVLCQQDVDQAYVAAVQAQGFPGPRDVRILYSPLHGVGTTAVPPVLAADGFRDVEIFGPHATADGDFPNVPNHIANPENKAVFDAIIVRARAAGSDLILASDPDCDRIGLAAPVSLAPGAAWATMSGNQIGALLTDYVLERWQQAGRLTPAHYIVKTLVTSELARRIADSYGARTFGDLLVGFKYIAGTMDEQGPEQFVFGTEESHGYLAGTYSRDKDAPVAAMLLAELTARLKSEGKSLHEKLDALFWQHGYHAETQISVAMPGSQGMQDMAALMARFRDDPPRELAGMRVARVRDYLHLQERAPGGAARPFQGPRGEMVMIDLDSPGCYVAVRPSGTEPKVKYYMFSYEPAEMLADLDDTKAQHATRLTQLGRDLTAFSQGKR